MADQTIKIWFSETNELRRFTPQGTEAREYAALVRRVTTLFPGLRGRTFTMQYADDENDVITVCNDAELAEAWSQVTNGTLRLRIVPSDPSKAAAAAPTPAPTPAAPTPAPAPAAPKASVPDPEIPDVTPPPPPPAPAAAPPNLLQFVEQLVGNVAQMTSMLQPAIAALQPAMAASMAAMQPELQKIQQTVGPKVAEAMSKLGPELEKMGPAIQQAVERAVPHIERAVQGMAAAGRRFDNVKVDVVVDNSDEDVAAAGAAAPSGPTAIFEHPHVVCDGCQGGIVGARFKCTVCPDFDLCGTCEATGMHADHIMLRIRVPGSAPQNFLRCFMPQFARFHHSQLGQQAMQQQQQWFPRRRHCGGPQASDAAPQTSTSTGGCPYRGRGRWWQQAQAQAQQQAQQAQQQQQQQQQQEEPPVMACGVMADLPVPSYATVVVPATAAPEPEPTPAEPTPAEPTPAEPTPTPTPAPAPAAEPVFAELPPPTPYVEQFNALTNMGFFDVGQLCFLLAKHSGNVSAVINELLQ